MSRCSHAFRATALIILVAAATAAEAGELSTSSRGTISISITIPPHVQVGRAGTSHLRGEAALADELCVETKGIHSYHVAVLGSPGSAQADFADARAAAVLPASRGDAICAPGGPAADITGIRVVETKPGIRPLPVTLLIIPD